MLYEGFFDKVYYRFWEVGKTNATANVFSIHGLGGHCLWFDKAANLLNENNINHFSFDLPGFGQSKYQRGYIDSYKTWVSVTKEILEKFLTHFNIKKPVFVLGHSMGSLIAIMLSTNVKPNGWILSVPGFQGNNKIFSTTKFVLPVLYKSLCTPMEPVILPFGPELLTRNKETQLKIKQDKLRVVNVSAQALKEVYFLSNKAQKNIQDINAPVLMLKAGQDMVCSLPIMDECFNAIKLDDKSKKVYTDFYHDLFLEDDLKLIISDISEWIAHHITSS